MSPAPAGRGQDGSRGDAYRVMVVDDSAVVRGLTTRFIEQDPDMQVVASVGNGQRALDQLARVNPEVVVLDVEMPVMDGLTALPKLMAAQPGLQVIMSSTLTQANADVTVRALKAGAADYVAKPSNRGLVSEADFQTELRAKVKALGAAARRSAGGKAPGGSAAAPASRTGGAGGSTGQAGAAQKTPERRTESPQPAAPRGTGRPPADGPVKLRAMPPYPPQVVAIGSSTGGPQALFEVLTNLGKISQPILITQHMPATFTALLADHIARQTSLPCREAKDGDKLESGHIYVAPGGHHLTTRREADGVRLRLSDGPAENFCRPSVDPMLRSLVEVYGSRVLGVILTGMGHDGLAGCENVVAAGGHVLGQDEASSVVWGMPGAVAKAGLCSAVLPLTEIAPQLRKIATRSAA